jgi:ABC-type branched-subunit amino acid transport system ATPase component
MKVPAEGLRLKGISAGYGEARILTGISIEIAPGEIVAVIGPNGSGKSTLAKAIAGVIQAAEGEVRIGDRLLNGLPPWERLRAGVAYVPQEMNVFPNMTVEENILIAGDFARLSRRQLNTQRDQALEFFPELKTKLRLRAGSLSGGERQILAFACGMLARPKAVVLDEPSAGLSPLLTQEIMGKIQSIRRTGAAIVLIEQNVLEALRIATRAAVLVNGSIRVTAAPGDFGAKYDLHEVYLG